MANDGNKAGMSCSLLATVNSKDVSENFIFTCKDKRRKTKVLYEILNIFYLNSFKSDHIINLSAKNICALTPLFSKDIWYTTYSDVYLSSQLAHLQNKIKS